MADTTSFTIGAQVTCSDGVCGAVTKVVVDPVAEIVTHLVIEPPPGAGAGAGAGRLVSLELAESTNGGVHLACTIEEFKKLETAEESQFIAGSSGPGNYAPLHAMSWPFDTIGGGLTLTEEEVEDLPVVELDHHEEWRVVGDVTLPAEGVLGGSGAAIDEILDHWADRERKQAQERLELKADRERFLQAFEDLSRDTIKPAMEAVVERLQRDGGGGIVWDGVSPTTGRPRRILWMSLEGEITGTPRQDRNPYLQLDANVIYRRIDVWEGDMWQKLGTSRATPPWQLNEITSESITERIVGILERAAGHNEAH